MIYVYLSLLLSYHNSSDSLDNYVQQQDIPRALRVFNQSKYRLTKDSIDRAYIYRNTVIKYSFQYQIPEWVLWGVLHNESNLTMVIGDHGVGMGIGQVRCSMKGTDRRNRKIFSWYSFLKEENIINTCSELFLDQDKSIHSVAKILAYNRRLAFKFFQVTHFNPLPNKIWETSILGYNAGNSAFNKKLKNKDYYFRVLFFGKNIVKSFEKPYCL